MYIRTACKANVFEGERNMKNYNIGDKIKVSFEIRGKLNLEDFGGDFIESLVYSTDEDISPDLLGVAETPWGEVIRVFKDQIHVKLLNQPLFQLDEETKQKISWGDHCLFDLKEDDFPVYNKLIEKYNKNEEFS